MRLEREAILKTWLTIPLICKDILKSNHSSQLAAKKSQKQSNTLVLQSA